MATTKPDNGRMIAVLRAVGMHDLGTYTDHARSISSRVFSMSRIALGRPSTPPDP
jgi:RimJ/RimL family protein N-acetyltransferase